MKQFILVLILASTGLAAAEQDGTRCPCGGSTKLLRCTCIKERRCTCRIVPTVDHRFYAKTINESNNGKYKHSLCNFLPCMFVCIVTFLSRVKYLRQGKQLQSHSKYPCPNGKNSVKAPISAPKSANDGPDD